MPLAREAGMYHRILVYGSPGAGKSRASTRISERTGIPVTHVDELIWNPGWEPVPDDEQRRRFEAVVSHEDWVLDGAFSAFRDVVVQRADLIIGLDYPRWLSLQRLIRRHLVNLLSRRAVCNGNVETWRDVVSRDSLVVWHFESFRRTQLRMRNWAAAAHGPDVLLFSWPRELDAWIATLGSEKGSEPRDHGPFRDI